MTTTPLPTPLDLDAWFALPENELERHELVAGYVTMSPGESYENRSAATKVVLAFHRVLGDDYLPVTDLDVVVSEVPATVRRPDVVIARRDALRGAKRVHGREVEVVVEVVSRGPSRRTGCANGPSTRLRECRSTSSSTCTTFHAWRCSTASRQGRAGRAEGLARRLRDRQEDRCRWEGITPPGGIVCAVPDCPSQQPASRARTMNDRGSAEETRREVTRHRPMSATRDDGHRFTTGRLDSPHLA